MNTLYYGDNLVILREYIPDESIDLIYLDPPFNSKATYNILFEEPTGESSEAQVTAFEDTWHWTRETERTFQEIVDTAPANVVEMMRAFRSFVGHNNDMMAYLTMMCIRLIELRRILKNTGSIYLHCDPAASHYLKILMDTIFAKKNFRNEIIWRRTNAHNKISRQYGPIHDVILFYSKSDKHIFHPGIRPYTRAYIGARFIHTDSRGIYQTNYLTGPGVRTGESGKEWRDFNPTKAGRHWAIPASLLQFLPNNGKGMYSLEKLECLLGQGLIVFPKKPGGQPMYKQYIGKGVPYQDLWTYQPNTNGTLYNTEECIDEDVKYLESEDEKLGYDTQKPVGILERMLATSSNEGDIVLDPFCGCGTTIMAAQRLRREWIGIDITHLAINLIKWRMRHMFGLKPGKDYEVVGEPMDLEGARTLAHQNRYQFQWWALSLIDARPYGDKKKGRDTGIDGYIYFVNGKDKIEKVIVQIKSGHVSVKDIRDLGHVIDREKAAIGLFMTLESPTKDMEQEAVSKGFYKKPDGIRVDKDCPKIQILTIEEVLQGKRPQMPEELREDAFKKAKAVNQTEQLEL